MPTLAEFAGLKVCMYREDRSPHHLLRPKRFGSHLRNSTCRICFLYHNSMKPTFHSIARKARMTRVGRLHGNLTPPPQLLLNVA